MPNPDQKKVAVLGGGVGAMVAAYELATSPGAEDKYDITVYQLGWRLGGKGASGRNAARGQRIEEHGAHIWFGFYENAFRVMGRAYDALDRRPGAPLRSLWDEHSPAFKPHTDFTLQEHRGADNWRDWYLSLPVFDDGKPGDGKKPRDLWMLIKYLLERLVKYFEWVLSEYADRQWVLTMGVQAAIKGRRSSLHRALLRARALHPSARHHSSAHRSLLGEHLKGFRDTLGAHLQTFTEDDDARRFWILMDLALTGLIGILADDVLIDGLDKLNDQDFATWMEGHGLSQAAQWSAPMRLVYDVIFAYENGDPTRESASLAAGTGIRGCLRLLFAYKEAPYYEMQAGMGDTVFTPFYQALVDLPNVRFEFFNQVERLVPTADGRSIQEIDITVQAKLNSQPPAGTDAPSSGYDPLVDVKGLPCWPSVPKFDEIKNGDHLRRLVERDGLDLENPEDPRWRTAWEAWQERGNTEPVVLRHGEHFDLVILGISLGALGDICQQLALTQKWRDMLAIPTVTTKSFQLWLDKSSKDMGWSGSAARDADPHPIAGAYATPYSTWADFTHLVDVEDWPSDSEPRSIAYFFGVVPDGGPGPVDQARQFVRDHIEYLWPNSVDASGFKLEWLIDLAGGSGEDRFRAQWFRENSHGSERYVLSTPNSIQCRLPAGESGFENLYLAGDWTKSGFDVGCVEAATMSGMQASRAICGHPRKIHGERDELDFGSLIVRWVLDIVPRLTSWIRYLWSSWG